MPRTVVLCTRRVKVGVGSDAACREHRGFRTFGNLGHVQMPDPELEANLARAAEKGAKRALADVGLEGKEAALRDLRSLVECIRLVRRTAVQTTVRMVTTGVMLALLAGINDAQRRMLEAAARRPRSRDELADRLRDGRF